MSATRQSPLLSVWLLLGYTFLYAPIVILIVFSFNESKLVTVWAGFSTKWYWELFQDRQMLMAAWLSLRLALMSATSAVALGVFAGLVMARFGRFRGHNLFASMITAPLVMPEVITGLSMLLLFVSMEKLIGWPAGRGMFTLWIAHVTFCSAFVAVVITSRLREMDESIEEAAMDLGAPGGCRRLAAGLHTVPGRPGHIELCSRSRCDNAAHESFFKCTSGGQPENQCPGNYPRPVRFSVCRRGRSLDVPRRKAT